MKKRFLALILAGMLLALTGCAPERAADPVQLTWYMLTEDVELYNELKGVAVIEEKTGVDVVFQSPPDNSYDAVICCQSFHHYPNVQNFFHSVYRVLRPGGRLIRRERARYATACFDRSS